MGGLYAAFDAERDRPETDVAAVCTEPAWEERIETEAALTKSLSNSGWEVAQLLKEWRLDSIC